MHVRQSILCARVCVCVGSPTFPRITIATLPNAYIRPILYTNMYVPFSVCSLAGRELYC